MNQGKHKQRSTKSKYTLSREEIAFIAKMIVLIKFTSYLRSHIKTSGINSVHDKIGVKIINTAIYAGFLRYLRTYQKPNGIGKRKV